jgi:hypothetical protein
MKRIQVRWKNFVGISAMTGNPKIYEADAFDKYGLNFIKEIKEMPKSHPLTFQAAVILYAHCIWEMEDAGQWINRYGGFVGCIASQGFHIQLNGDEYQVITST